MNDIRTFTDTDGNTIELDRSRIINAHCLDDDELLVSFKPDVVSLEEHKRRVWTECEINIRADPIEFEAWSGKKVAMLKLLNGSALSANRREVFF